MITCRGCDATWTGTSRCHCSACHRLFSSLSGFDAHQVGGRCSDPATLRSKGGERLLFFTDGIWSAAAEPDRMAGLREYRRKKVAGSA